MAPALFVCVCVCVRVCTSVRAGLCVCLTGVGVPQCVLGFKYPPSIEAGRRDKGWGNRKINGRMEPCRYRAVPINSHWGKGDSKTFPARSLAHSLLLFDWNYTTFITASHSSLCLCQFFHLSLPWGSPSFFIHESVPHVFFPPENLFENVKPCTIFVFLKNVWGIKICWNVASPFEKGF